MGVPTQRLLAAGLLVAAALALAVWPRSTHSGTPEVGQVQPRTILADFDFPVLRDPTELAVERETRAATVPAVVVREDSASVSAYQRLGWLRDRVDRLRSRAGGEPNLGEEGELVLSFSQPTLIALLLGDRSREILEQAEILLLEVMQRGYVSSELAGRLDDYSAVRIQDPLGAATMPTAQLLTADRVREFARARAVSRGLPHQALGEIVLYCATPNLVLDASGTEALMDQAMEQVPPHTRLVRKGEKIIGAHEVVTPEVLRVLQSYEYWRGENGGRERRLARLYEALGSAILVFVLCGAFFGYLWMHRRPLLERPSDFWLLLTIEVTILFLAWLLAIRLDLPHVLVPVAAVAILVALHFDARLAIATSLLPTFLVGMVAGGGVSFLAVVGVGMVVAVLLTPSLRQRREFYRILGAVAGVHLAILLGLSLVDGGELDLFRRQALAAAANPFLATAVVLALLPVSESVFRRCTDVSLYELVDLNRPLLQRLMLAAPGTYHHSLMVGALAEAAAQAVGANPLLARVIGYYHDVGKLTKPELFSENATGESMSGLTPSMRRVILESHVREGERLAEKEKLPREVRAGIREHHGIAEMEGGLAVAPEGETGGRPGAPLRYPGPIPSTPESALVLLANAVDEEARSLEDPSPARVQTLISEIVHRHVREGNLDASGLRVDDLAKVRKTFVTMLSAAYRGSGRGREVESDGDAAAPPDHPAISGG